MSTWTRKQDSGCSENPGTFDTGNGALKFVDVNPKYPGVLRITIESYCGRDSDNMLYYSLIDGGGYFETAAQAMKARP